MKKKENYYTLVSIGIIVIILILIFVIIDKYNINSSIKYGINTINDINIAKEMITNDAFENRAIQKSNNTFYRINNWNNYLDGISCINSYNNSITNLYDQKNGKLSYKLDYEPDEELLKSLDKSYVSKKGLSLKNIDTLATGEYSFVPTSAYYSIQSNYNLLVYGYLINKESNTTEDYGYLVQMNYIVNTYSIIPFDEVKDMGLANIEDGASKDIQKERIEEGAKLFPTTASDRTIANHLLTNFKNNAIYKPELAFKQLDNEYAKKFGNVEGFKQYIEQNRDKLKKISLSNVEKQNTTEGYVLYKCYEDGNTSYYIQYSEEDFLEIKLKFSNIIL